MILAFPIGSNQAEECQLEDASKINCCLDY